MVIARAEQHPQALQTYFAVLFVAVLAGLIAVLCIAFRDEGVASFAFWRFAAASVGTGVLTGAFVLGAFRKHGATIALTADEIFQRVHATDGSGRFVSERQWKRRAVVEIVPVTPARRCELRFADGEALELNLAWRGGRDVLRELLREHPAHRPSP